jgi:hypothetical protein
MEKSRLQKNLVVYKKAESKIVKQLRLQTEKKANYILQQRRAIPEK